MKITRGIFERQRQRRFGTANPEHMPFAFWEWMVRAAEDARIRDEPFPEQNPAVLGHSPYTVRQYFGLDGDYSAGPIWNFERMGATRTPHPDGGMICIGGEHEDYYDPDFCIYNDVIVLDLNGSVEIYGYPQNLFPPTDFHTAARVGDRLIIIGRLGYINERHPGTTPVFAVDLANYRIAELTSHGEVPGWVFGHAAEFVEDGLISVRGGEIFEKNHGEPTIRRNFDDFAYEIGTGHWDRLTNRKWRQFSIRDAGGKSLLLGPPLNECLSFDYPVDIPTPNEYFVYVKSEALLPRSFAYEAIWSDEPSVDYRILVEGIPVSIELHGSAIEIVIEGEMKPDLADALASDIKEGVEADTRRSFLVQRSS